MGEEGVAGLENALPDLLGARTRALGLSAGVAPGMNVQQHLVQLVHPLVTLLPRVCTEPAPANQRRRRRRTLRRGWKDIMYSLCPRLHL